VRSSPPVWSTFPVLGYDFKGDERLRVYLTNTLEEAHEMTGLPLFTQWLAEEANAASEIKKEVPVMVVLGNPPYSVSSQNKGDWITELLEDYKKDLKEKKLNLDDDVIKFFRFAQWRIDQTGYGVLAFISNHTYLEGITHRRMRESLLGTFDDIYVLDLHGSKVKNETNDCPEDNNVFDIKQGVAIGIFVKRKKRPGNATVYRGDLYGSREQKYSYLLTNDVSTTEWAKVQDTKRNTCLGQFFFFANKSFENIGEYCHGKSTKDIFIEGTSAIQTKRDELFVSFEEGTLRKTFLDISINRLSPETLE
jgi:predicted helicase